jgi:hypothetical protein
MNDIAAAAGIEVEVGEIWAVLRTMAWNSLC